MYQIHARIKSVSILDVRIMGKTGVSALEILCGIQTEQTALVRNHAYLTSGKRINTLIYFN